MALFSLLFPPTPSLLPSSLLPRTPLPQTLISGTPRISIRSPGNRSCSAFQPRRRSSTSSAPFITSESSNSTRIFVKGLSRSTSEGYLAYIFSCFGEVCRVKLVTSRAAREPLGFAYIWFGSEEQAELAVKEMDGKFVDGRFIAVVMARPESPSSHVKPPPFRFNSSYSQLRRKSDEK